MFKNERPIEVSKDDLLGRSDFSSTLAQSILEYKELDSLVIALYGKWGSGKSSVINLAKEALSQSSLAGKPTVIEFNPWLFSGDEKLNEHFFNEIAKELKINSKRDIELANKLRMYSKLLSLIPNESSLNKSVKSILTIVGLIGISGGQILQWFHLDLGKGKLVSFAVGAILLAVSLINGIVDRIADFLEKRSAITAPTVMSLKKKIKKVLQKRESKILVIMDDIDRLSPDEIRMILKLIKINSDFPNIIYLLSFDREVIQKALELQPGVNGQDYVEKIVQVNFNVPLAKHEKISNILVKELNLILERLPKAAEGYLDHVYWGNVYHSGLKNFFRNIRDVKRFASSLDFNLSLMHKGESMEVNPIDFIAIEAFRIFSPEFYDFMRTKNELFTNIERVSGASSNERKKEIEQGLTEIPEYLREDAKNLLGRLFPQIEKLIGAAYLSYDASSYAIWNRNLRVCSPKFFDAYFTLIPGGDESEVSQFEVDLLLSTIQNESEFKNGLNKYLENGKIKKILERIQDYTGDKVKVPLSANLDVVQALFNISDILPSEREGFLISGNDMQCARIIYQLLIRNENKKDNFDLLMKAIRESKGLYGPVFNVGIISENDNKPAVEQLVTSEMLPELQKACTEKIGEFAANGNLVKNKEFTTIVRWWKGWSKENSWENYIKGLVASDQGLIDCLRHFEVTITMNTAGDLVSRTRKSFSYKSLADFINLDIVKTKLEAIKATNQDIYIHNTAIVEVFLDNFDIRNTLRY